MKKGSTACHKNQTRNRSDGEEERRMEKTINEDMGGELRIIK